MLETVKLPAGISDLDTGLANVDRDALSHFARENRKKIAETKKCKSEEEEAFMKTPSAAALRDGESEMGANEFIV